MLRGGGGGGGGEQWARISKFLFTNNPNLFFLWRGGDGGGRLELE